MRMGLFDGIKRTLSGDRGQPPRTDKSDNRIKCSPWIIDGDDIVRQYNFYGPPNSAETVFQIGCTVEMGSFGFLHRHVFFFLTPKLTDAEGFLSAFLGTIDEGEETGFFPIQIAAPPNGGNMLMVREQQYADKCLSVFGACKPIRFLLMDMRECIVNLTLYNDATFGPAFSTLQNAKMGR